MKNTTSTTFPIVIAASMLILASASGLAQGKPTECIELVGTVNASHCLPIGVEGFCGEMTTNLGTAYFEMTVDEGEFKPTKTTPSGNSILKLTTSVEFLDAPYGGQTIVTRDRATCPAIEVGNENVCRFRSNMNVLDDGSGSEGQLSADGYLNWHGFTFEILPVVGYFIEGMICGLSGGVE
jgi:hypothetical protein